MDASQNSPTPESQSNLQRKALKVARLACSADRVGSAEEAKTAAQKAGALARAGGWTLDQLGDAIGSLRGAETAWCHMVDGWYDAAAAAVAS